MDDKVEDILKCHVCLGNYDSNAQRPLLLPACGHTFCASCLENLQKQSRMGCPECRKANAILPVANLPVNYVVLNLIQARQQKQKQDQGRVEGIPVPHGRPSFANRRCSDPPSVDEVSFSPPRPLRRSGSTSSRNEQFPYHSPERPVNPASHVMSGGSLRLSPSRQLRRSASARSDYHPNQLFGLSGDAVAMSPPPPRPLRRSGSIRNEYSDHNLQHYHGGPRMFDGRRSQPVNHALPGTPFFGARACPQPHHGSGTDENEKCVRALQEELDFQMAIHLTFCKNPSHGHDDGGAVCTARHNGRWQYPEDDDINTALLLSRVNLN